MPRKSLVDLIIESAQEKLARDIKILDVKKQSALWDHQVLMTADSPAQINAIVDEITETVAKKYPDMPVIRALGAVASGWVILDLGPVIVHILQEKVRQHYSLEEIWKQSGVTFHY
jgi:ribosome-associated protein